MRKLWEFSSREKSYAASNLTIQVKNWKTVAKSRDVWRRPGPIQGSRAVEEEDESKRSQLIHESTNLEQKVVGRVSLVVKVMVSFQACQVFDQRTSEDPPCRSVRCTLNRSILKRPLVGVVLLGGTS
ncbi:hypothetical protein TNCV_3644581 [Trichonephila clavipes]|nr:hypothetical protein TNCV_3644581 [Trichonephila clavipes]